MASASELNLAKDVISRMNKDDLSALLKSIQARKGAISPSDALAVTEVLEHVISYLPIKDQFIAMRVSEKFYDTIINSVSLRRAMFVEHRPLPQSNNRRTAITNPLLAEDLGFLDDLGFRFKGVSYSLQPQSIVYLDLEATHGDFEWYVEGAADRQKATKAGSWDSTKIIAYPLTVRLRFQWNDFKSIAPTVLNVPSEAATLGHLYQLVADARKKLDEWEMETKEIAAREHTRRMLDLNLQTDAEYMMEHGMVG